VTVYPCRIDSAATDGRPIPASERAQTYVSLSAWQTPHSPDDNERRVAAGLPLPHVRMTEFG
jgi:hypothetical protein